MRGYGRGYMYADVQQQQSMLLHQHVCTRCVCAHCIDCTRSSWWRACHDTNERASISCCENTRGRRLLRPRKSVNGGQPISALNGHLLLSSSSGNSPASTKLTCTCGGKKQNSAATSLLGHLLSVCANMYNQTNSASARIRLVVIDKEHTCAYFYCCTFEVPSMVRIVQN